MTDTETEQAHTKQTALQQQNMIATDIKWVHQKQIQTVLLQLTTNMDIKQVLIKRTHQAEPQNMINMAEKLVVTNKNIVLYKY